MAICKGCGQEIRWVKTPTGKAMPCDPELLELTYLDPAGLAPTLVQENGVVVRAAPVGTKGRIPHWATCPKAKDFKPKEKK